LFALINTGNGMGSVVQSGQKDPVQVLETVYELQWDAHELTYRTTGGQWEIEDVGVVW
jgi:hypothetical protein